MRAGCSTLPGSIKCTVGLLLSGPEQPRQIAGHCLLQQLVALVLPWCNVVAPATQLTASAAQPHQHSSAVQLPPRKGKRVNDSTKMPTKTLYGMLYETLTTP
jgi:hypothetical protein